MIHPRTAAPCPWGRGGREPRRPIARASLGPVNRIAINRVALLLIAILLIAILLIAIYIIIAIPIE